MLVFGGLGCADIFNVYNSLLSREISSSLSMERFSGYEVSCVVVVLVVVVVLLLLPLLLLLLLLMLLLLLLLPMIFLPVDVVDELRSDSKRLSFCVSLDKLVLDISNSLVKNWIVNCRSFIAVLYSEADFIGDFIEVGDEATELKKN